MIDTIKFKIPISEKIYDLLIKKSIQTIRKDYISKTIIFNYINTPINVGSFSREITISTQKDDSFCTIEFSIPKIIYGHNVLLISEVQVIEGIRMVYEAIVKEIGQFTPYKEWIVKRIDLCYAWKYTQPEVEETLKTLKYLNYVNFKKHIYKTALMFTGSQYAVKFYLKYPEYLLHDYKALYSTKEPNLAFKILDLSKGVIRFEVTLRSAKLEYLFGKNKNITDILSHDLYQVLKTFLSKFTKLENKMIGLIEVQELLKRKYGGKRGVILYQFYRLYFSNEEIDKQMLLDNYSKSTIYNNLKLLREAGIGIIQENIDKPINLDIPSQNVVR